MPDTPFTSRIMLRGEQTAGAVSMVEVTARAGWAGPPLHHHAFDEAFYVLDGELTFQIGDELATAGPGAHVFAPGGAVHTLANLGRSDARYLLVCTPAGFERRFDGPEEPLPGVDSVPAAARPMPETTVVGPTIGERGDRGRPEPIAPARGRVNVLVRGEQGSGRVSLMDNHVRAGFAGPPLHRHGFDEAFHVLEGELTFRLGDELFTRRAGELAFAPRGVAHTFVNLGDADARTLIVCTPAGFERYFARIAANERGEDPPEWALAPTPEVEVLGGPIGSAERGPRGA